MCQSPFCYWKKSHAKQLIERKASICLKVFEVSLGGWMALLPLDPWGSTALW